MQSFRRCSLFVAMALAGGASFVPFPAFADEDDDVALVCEEPHDLDPHQLLRRLSLDLAGGVPDLVAYEALDALAGDEEATTEHFDEVVDELVASDGFRLSMRRYHEAMLWPNIQDVRIADNRIILQKQGGILQSTSSGRRNEWRGDPDAPCGDFEHGSFDPDFPGEYRPLPEDGEDGEWGWRMVEPYWAPGTTEKVCVHEAQETEVGGGETCNSFEGAKKPDCGCGEGLRYCYAPQSATETAVRDALREQLMRAVDDAVAEGADYTDLVLGTSAWQDGRLAFWKKHLATSVSYSRTYNAPDPGDEVEGEPDPTDTTFERVPRGEAHAGVLTLPGFLLKFQTARGRVNRFRQAFLCQSFEPPATTETEEDGCSDTDGDLTNRCTCRYCHATLEPMATAFHRFAEAGTTVLDDEDVFPRFDASCAGSNLAHCKRFYVTASESPRAGWLLPLELADAHDDYEAAFEEGPRAIVEASIWQDGDPSADPLVGPGSFSNCAVRRAFTHFVRRAPTEAEEETIEALATSFADGGFSYRDLVRGIVSLDAYRRIR